MFNVDNMTTKRRFPTKDSSSLEVKFLREEIQNLEEDNKRLRLKLAIVTAVAAFLFCTLALVAN